MAYVNEQVQDLLNAATDAGYWVRVVNDGITDYRGDVMSDALDAVLAVDEAEVTFYSEEDCRFTVIGWALILPGLDEEEQIADCSGWVSIWMDER